MAEARKLLPDVDYCDDAYEAMAGADALVLLTEWNEFRALDLGRVKSLLRPPMVIDLRNIYKPDEMAAAGLLPISASAARRGRRPAPADLRAIA